MPATQNKNQNQKQNLLEKSLRYLGVRARSKYELQKYLQDKTEDLQLIDDVLSELISFGFINDDQFATDFINSRLRNRPKGQLYMKNELTKRFGVNKAVVDQKIRLVSLDQWLNAARTVISKKSKTLAKFSGQKLKAKIYYYLKSRGFSEEVITITIDEQLSGK